MNQLSFDFNGTSVRVVMLDGEPWFVARDVCKVLEITKVDSAIRNLDADEKGAHTVSTPGGNQEMTIVSEAGLYSLILRSRKPEAKSFKRWVTHEVLPSIRKTGVYAVNQDHAELDINEELLNTTKALVLHINRQLLNGVNLPAGLLNYARTVCRTFCVSVPILPPVAVDPEIMTVMDNLRRGVRYSRNTVYQDYCSRCSGVPKSSRAFWPCARKYCPFADVRTADGRYIILEED